MAGVQKLARASPAIGDRRARLKGSRARARRTGRTPATYRGIYMATHIEPRGIYMEETRAAGS
jgi:hypothetical protein